MNLTSGVIKKHGKVEWLALRGDVIDSREEKCLNTIGSRMILSTSTRVEGTGLLGKRAYLSDYKIRYLPFTLNSIWFDTFGAAFLAFFPVTTNYASYMDRLEAATTENPCLEEFDVEERLKEKIPFFKQKLLQFYSVTALHFSFEKLAVTYLPLRTADRLTKDMAISLGRKIARSELSNLDIAFKMLKTVSWSKGLKFLSMFTYDMIYGCYNANWKKIRPTRAALWVLKKALVCGAAWKAHALGFSLGTESHRIS